MVFAQTYNEEVYTLKRLGEHISKIAEQFEIVDKILHSEDEELTWDYSFIGNKITEMMQLCEECKLLHL